MPLVLDREQVLGLYAEAAERKWVLPTFNAENLTTCEAILSAVLEYGQTIDIPDLPVIIGITNLYPPRPQSLYYTHTRQWQVGLRLFLEEMKVLLSDTSPFAELRVMLHLDHIQWDMDAEILHWDMCSFSSIMYDASNLPLQENIARTAAFREKYGHSVVVEGACDEIGKTGSANQMYLTSPDEAERYWKETGVDIIVANLGTEHRAAASELRYHAQLAREITRRIKPCLCLHGTSSVPVDSLHNLFNDGIRKVNIWTVLERESSALLFREMVKNATKIVGHEEVKRMQRDGLLGPQAKTAETASVEYFTTTYRQGIVFEKMKEIVTRYLKAFYRYKKEND
ncbi:MAG TPA: class II fructose-bisphosphate aldolase [Caldithrix abyssi]|uniref:Class II fructose-bisphosphate aldolase n=1 Tax=Caldithrix abyssi TaxID=187145 RepID=A0A7V4TZP3_CALAY|nr:class II fructose-bisphosphate aldolase [Caldithrix abyssi]